jgi:hypothetical protein
VTHINILILIIGALIGLSFSGIVPLLVSTGSTLYEKGRGLLLTVVLASGNSGHMVSPHITRYIAKLNIDYSIYLSLIYMLIVLIFGLLLTRYIKKVAI